ncbi:M28 family peptidase [Methyloterricola oryzae]|uniref:M28 family peptidase n=1 Tax=Methyloterricola oryzae TaxID=1495050 RepID=UPI0005EB67E8|nr:M28 family peptidase [Methyloterricola oryzae]
MVYEALQDSLRRHVFRLAGEIGERNVFHYDALQAAAGYVRGVWEDQGFEVVSQAYEANGLVCENLAVTCPGAGPGLILVGAHYDSVKGSPGANDNGSGVAGLLEISRALSQATPAMTVRCVAFVNEEPPFFYWGKMGSLVYAKAARARSDAIRLMVSLEMLGCYHQEPGTQDYPPLLGYFYPDTGNFIAFVSNLKSSGLLRKTVQAFQTHSDFPLQSLAAPSLVPGVGWSDQLSFWREGYKALMVTDTAFFRYPYYHTAADTPDKIDYASMARVVAGLQRTFEGLRV